MAPQSGFPAPQYPPTRRWLIGGGALIAVMCLCALALLAATGWTIVASAQEANKLATAQAGATATALELLTHPPADWTGVFVDDFETAGSGWDLMGYSSDPLGAGDFSITGGKYKWQVEANQPFYWWSDAPAAGSGDFYVSVEADQLSGSHENIAYGLAYRYTDFDNLSLFLIRENGTFQIGKFAKNVWRDLHYLSRTDAVFADKPNKIAVMARGNHFWFLINDQVVADLDEPDPPRGAFAIAVSFDQGSETANLVFDNFTLRTPK